VFGDIIQPLNNRELAITFWIVIAVIWILCYSKYRESIAGIIKAFFVWKIIIPILFMLLYICLMLICLYSIGIWRFTQTTNTILWIVGVAFVLLFKLTSTNNPDIFKDSIRDLFKALVVLEFIINLYVFNLWIELIIFPILFVMFFMSAIADNDKEYAPVKGCLNYVLAFIGFIFVTYAVYMMIADFRGFISFENLESFITPIMLSILILPFIYGMALYSSYESLFIRLRFYIEDESLYKYMKRKTILSFNLNLWALNRWSNKLNIFKLSCDRESVDEAFKEFKKQYD
jgi:hypothetical protein